jgi:hypothetical protein
MISNERVHHQSFASCSKAFLGLWSLFFLTVLLLCSCAKEKSLSSVQKDQILGSLQSSGRAYNAARRNISITSDQDWAIASLPSIDESDPTLSQMAHVLKDRIKSRICRIRLVAPNNFRSENIQGIKRTFMLLNVWGDPECPIQLQFKITTLLEPSIGRRAISYDYSYQVSDPSYRKLNDVDSIELHGGMSFNGLHTSHVLSETDFEGSIHSQANGKIQIQFSGKLEGPHPDFMNGETTWAFSYPDFTAEFRKKYDNGNSSLFINQESVAAVDFENYFSTGGDPFHYGYRLDLIY